MTLANSVYQIKNLVLKDKRKKYTEKNLSSNYCNEKHLYCHQ